MNVVRILGTRGVPAAHGGFETFAEHLALYLVQRGWRVVVYCQKDGNAPISEDTWQGVERVFISTQRTGPAGTMEFDWEAVRHASRHSDLCLTLGYNTAVFCAWLRLSRVPNIINMDGIEWSRAKWGWPAKIWLWMNDWAGCWLGNHLVADHPAIKSHLLTRTREDKITTIAYGADRIHDAPQELVTALGLQPGRYLTVIARPEPENSVLEIVEGFSLKPRGLQLAVLGNYDPAHPFHRAVQKAASSEVRFLGAIYDKPVVQALRFHSAAYIHGHQVGGTNPSLVEALGAGNAVIAHDNPFNRWVVGVDGRYFSSSVSFAAALDDLLSRPEQLPAMRAASLARFEAEFSWDRILKRYEELLFRFIPRPMG